MIWGLQTLCECSCPSQCALLIGASREDRDPPTPVVRAHVIPAGYSFLRIIFVFGRLDLPFAKYLGLLQNKFNLIQLFILSSCFIEK